MTEATAVASGQRTTRLYNIGNAWINTKRRDGSALGPKDPVISVSVSNNIGLETVSLKPGSRLLFFPNTNKREGKQDADYRVAVELPKEIADALINARSKQTAEVKVS